MSPKFRTACVAMWTWPLSVGVLVVVSVLYAREREREREWVRLLALYSRDSRRKPRRHGLYLKVYASKDSGGMPNAPLSTEGPYPGGAAAARLPGPRAWTRS
eukprot:scaffold21588_cov135-Isochrysis_galbana.AAC.4